MSLFPLGLALAALVSSAPPPGDECLGFDDDGRSYPVCFDPGEGLELGVGVMMRRTWSGAVGAGTALQVRAGILLRTERRSRSKPDSRWFFEQRLLSTTLEPLDKLRAVRFTLYEGTFHRHLDEGFILVPTARPLRLPFPFDLAFHTRVGHLERRVFDGAGMKVEVVRAGLLLDAVRDPSRRVHAALGPALSYTVRTDRQTWTHELSPFTSLMLDLGAETADGWWRTRLTGIAGWATAPGGGSFFRAAAEATVDRLLFAVNDQPLWVSVGVNGAQREAGVFRTTEVVGSVSLVMRAFQ